MFLLVLESKGHENKPTTAARESQHHSSLSCHEGKLQNFLFILWSLCAGSPKGCGCLKKKKETQMLFTQSLVFPKFSKKLKSDFGPKKKPSKRVFKFHVVEVKSRGSESASHSRGNVSPAGISVWRGRNLERFLERFLEKQASRLLISLLLFQGYVCQFVVTDQVWENTCYWGIKVKNNPPDRHKVNFMSFVLV